MTTDKSTPGASVLVVMARDFILVDLFMPRPTFTYSLRILVLSLLTVFSAVTNWHCMYRCALHCQAAIAPSGTKVVQHVFNLLADQVSTSLVAAAW